MNLTFVSGYLRFCDALCFFLVTDTSFGIQVLIEFHPLSCSNRKVRPTFDLWLWFQSLLMNQPVPRNFLGMRCTMSGLRRFLRTGLSIKSCENNIEKPVSIRLSSTKRWLTKIPEFHPRVPKVRLSISSQSSLEKMFSMFRRSQLKKTCFSRNFQSPKLKSRTTTCIIQTVCLKLGEQGWSASFLLSRRRNLVSCNPSTDRWTCERRVKLVSRPSPMDFQCAADSVSRVWVFQHQVRLNCFPIQFRPQGRVFSCHPDPWIFWWEHAWF